MIDRLSLSPTGRHVVLRPTPALLPHGDIRAWFARRPGSDAAMFRIAARLSGEALGFVRIDEAAESGRAAIAVAGTTASVTMLPVLVDAAVVASGFAFGDARADAVAVSMLGAGGALCRRMRTLGFRQDGRPRAALPSRLGSSGREAVFRLGRSALDAVRARHEAEIESPSSWLFVPPHAFPA